MNDNLPLILLPPDLSDEAAGQLFDFLHQLLMTVENYYADPIQRHLSATTSSHDEDQYDLWEDDGPPF